MNNRLGLLVLTIVMPLGMLSACAGEPSTDELARSFVEFGTATPSEARCFAQELKRSGVLSKKELWLLADRKKLDESSDKVKDRMDDKLDTIIGEIYAHCAE